MTVWATATVCRSLISMHNAVVGVERDRKFWSIYELALQLHWSHNNLGRSSYILFILVYVKILLSWYGSNHITTSLMRVTTRPIHIKVEPLSSCSTMEKMQTLGWLYNITEPVQYTHHKLIYIHFIITKPVMRKSYSAPLYPS